MLDTFNSSSVSFQFYVNAGGNKNAYSKRVKTEGRKHHTYEV